ncbi:preprotein translocase subunit YajC [Saccharomonospora amisosensis]|uniref:Preprotein translocase subunit YajC n=1 Tax=Saccharomonospora amisosensis TaxID=1128677 RepID=A0A7X5ZQB1_9PSEU|nr:preprotein translocase subunit YajC [Saccharomonospora amisosensis]NIJ11634.1 preprotein translocase subunit YajC [Saccharomonospora amisosensis]
MEGLFLPLLLMLVVAIPLVMSTRKQKRMMAQQQELQNSLAEGDRVMTTSGLYATVADASDETTIDLEIAEGVVTTWLRQAVRERINPVVDEELSSADDTDTDSAESSVTDDTSAEDKGSSGAKVAPPLEHGKK